MNGFNQTLSMRFPVGPINKPAGFFLAQSQQLLPLKHRLAGQLGESFGQRVLSGKLHISIRADNQ